MSDIAPIKKTRKRMKKIINEADAVGEVDAVANANAVAVGEAPVPAVGAVGERVVVRLQDGVLLRHLGQQAVLQRRDVVHGTGVVRAQDEVPEHVVAGTREAELEVVEDDDDGLRAKHVVARLVDDLDRDRLRYPPVGLDRPLRHAAIGTDIGRADDEVRIGGGRLLDHQREAARVERLRQQEARAGMHRRLGALGREAARHQDDRQVRPVALLVGADPTGQPEAGLVRQVRLHERQIEDPGIAGDHGAGFIGVGDLDDFGGASRRHRLLDQLACDLIGVGHQNTERRGHAKGLRVLAGDIGFILNPVTRIPDIMNR